MRAVRPAAVAGAFYPGRRATLARMVAELLADAARQLPADTPVPKALILPHAGYVYSGSTAALGYAALAPGRDRIRRVILLGPTHRVAVDGLALPDAEAFETPLGFMTVATVDPATRAGLPQLVDSALVHAMEHSLEVHVPFLQTVLPEATLIPVAVGWVDPPSVAAVIEALWGGPETVVVVSSDLSHYLPYDRAHSVDRVTVDQILRLDGSLSHDQACGATPVNGLLVVARRRGLEPRLLGMCNSGDTAGDRGRVVGYAAVVFAEPSHE